MGVWRGVGGAIRYPATFIVSVPSTGGAVALSEGCQFFFPLHSVEIWLLLIRFSAASAEFLPLSLSLPLPLSFSPSLFLSLDSLFRGAITQKDW